MTVNVVKECFQRQDALTYATREVAPFNGRDDSRDEVKWEGPFFATEREGHASFSEGATELVKT
jgi:hypothetical protein